MSQVKTRMISVKAVLSTAAFRAGFEEVQRGKPFNPNAFVSDSHRSVGGLSWCYERGRQFGIVYKGPLKQGRTITTDAILAYVSAIRERSII